MKSDRPLKLLDMDKIISLSQTQNAPYPGVVVNSNPCVVNSQQSSPEEFLKLNGIVAASSCNRYPIPRRKVSTFQMINN